MNTCTVFRRSTLQSKHSIRPQTDLFCFALSPPSRQQLALPFVGFTGWFPTSRRVTSLQHFLISLATHNLSTETKCHCPPFRPKYRKAGSCVLQQANIPFLSCYASFAQIGTYDFLRPRTANLRGQTGQLGAVFTRKAKRGMTDSKASTAIRRRPRCAAAPRSTILCLDSVSPSKDETLRLEALSHFKNGDLKKASDLLKTSIKVRPENGRAWQDFAKVEGLRQQSAEASAVILKRALDFNSRNPYLWQSRGFYLWRLRKHDSARRCFEKGLMVDPSHASLYTTYARLEYEQKHHVRARELFEKGVMAGASDARLFHSWGLMEMKLGNTGRARCLFQKGLALDKQNPFIWHSLAVVARKEGDVNRSRICYENALKTGRSGVAVFDALAKLEAGEGNDESARGLFSEGVAAFPNDVRILHSWSVFEYQRGKLDVAKDLIRSALKKNSKDSFLWTHYAKIEEARANYPLARTLFKRACAVCPRDWRAWDQWSEMEHKLGNLREAEVLLKESFRIRFRAKGAFTILANSIRDKY